MEERVKELLGRLGRGSAANPRKVFLAVAVIVLVSVLLAASSVQMSMGMSLYIDHDSRTWEDWTDLKQDYDEGNNVFVVVESDSLTDPATVRTIDRLDRRIKSVDDVSGVTSLADVIRTGSGGNIPDTRYGVEHAIQNVSQQGDTSASLVDNLVPRKDTTVMLASYGDVDMLDSAAFMPRSDSSVIESEIRSETEFVTLPPGTTVTVTGQPVFENAAFGLMLPEMILLFTGAFTLILAAVYLLMRRKLQRGWHVVLPLTTTILALLVMMGAMGLLDNDFNAIMLGVMPIAMGLGIDYGLQIQTRYTDEREKGKPPLDAVEVASRTTGRAVLLAMATTTIGLGSLFISSVPPVQQFGVTSASSVVASMLLSVTLLPALLVKYDSAPEVGRDGLSVDPIANAFERLTANVVAHKPHITLAIAAVLVLGGAWAYPQVEPKQEMMDFWPQDLEAKNDLESLSDTVDSPKVVYVLVEGGDVYTPETFRRLEEYQRVMLANPSVNAVQSPVTSVENRGGVPDTQHALDARFADTETLAGGSDNGMGMRLAFYVDDVEGTEVRTLIDEFRGNADLLLDGDVQVTGKPVLNRNVIENVTAGLTPMTFLSFTLGLLFLIVAFRSLRVAAVLVGGVAATAALLVTAAMFVSGVPWNPLTVTMSSITLGIGIDYGIHVYERYEEERVENGKSSLDAVSTSVARLSRPVLGSSLTTIAGFGVLVLSRFPVLSNFGWTTVYSIAFSVAASLVVLPALLVAVRVLRDGERVAWR